MTPASQPKTRSPARIVASARDLLGTEPDAIRITMRLLASQLATHLGLPPIAWPRLAGPAGVRAAAAAGQLAELDMTGWDMSDVGAAYEQLMTPAGRRAQGTWYTPPEMAAAMVRLSIGPQLDRLAASPDPEDVLQVLAVDPACGAGVFLVAAARFIADRYCLRLMGAASSLMLRLVMPDVISECVFGMDRDPIAVDLAKAALWIELDGARPLEFLDRNVVCCDALSGPHAQPPKLAERRGEPTWSAACPEACCARPSRG